jgi:membrane peptidoglycan carboxypeptidase
MRRTTLARTALVACALALAGSACTKIDHLPRLGRADLRFRPAQSSKIFAADGTEITTLHGVEDRTVIPLKEIPVYLRRAVVAVEDQRFYRHDGVDVRAIVRAALANASSGTIKQGGSTITQQYVKTVIIAPGETAARTLERKINEAALARQIEQRLGKKEILARYLNTVYFGSGAYGVQAAAKTYFGKEASELTLAESALLAGVVRSPEDYDPFDRPRAAAARRNLVLDKMLELGWASPRKVARAKAHKIKLRPPQKDRRYPAPYFVDYVRRLIKFDDRFDVLGKTPAQRERQLFNGGLRIHTTVDLEAQAAAERAVETVLPHRNDPYASLVSVKPANGHIKAMVGGRNYFAPPRKDRFAKFNLAISGEPGLGTRGKGNYSAGTGRQAGSSFKPFALAAALEKGVSLSQTYEAAPCMDFPGADNGGTWHVCNYEGADFGSNISLLEATINSVNVVYAQLIMEVGPEPVVDLARKMGVDTPLQPVNSAVLGTNPVNPLNMASAFGTLAAAGRHHPPVAITKITNAEGKVVYRDRSRPERAMNTATAYITTSALEQVMQRGTGVGASIGRPAAGKTGTAQEYRDAWFVGYTPNLATAVWVGYPGGEIEMKPSCVGSTQPCRVTRTATSGGVTGGSWPASIWRLFMLRALSDVPARPFPIPEAGVTTVLIDTRNGCLADEFTPPEYRASTTFIEGTQPDRVCREPGDVVRVPDVFSFPLKDALRILQDSGLAPNVREKPTSTYPPGRVIGVSPRAGTKVPGGSTVTLTVSARSELVAVPGVLGLERGEATQAIEDAGLDVETIVEPESDEAQARRKAGLVWKQAPAGGSEADKGSTVTIWINPD